jgi:hypothetical protein
VIKKENLMPPPSMAFESTPRNLDNSFLLNYNFKFDFTLFLCSLFVFNALCAGIIFYKNYQSKNIRSYFRALYALIANITALLFVAQFYIAQYSVMFMCFCFLFNIWIKMSWGIKLFNIFSAADSHKKSLFSMMLVFMVSIVIDFSWMITLLENMNISGQIKISTFGAFVA